MGNSAEQAILSLALAASSSCCIGRYVGLSANRLPLVERAGPGSISVEARTTCDAFWNGEGVAIGATVTLQFERGDPDLPVVTGVLRTPTSASSPKIRVDGEEVRLQGQRRIELVCGDASIVLTANGKVLIKGVEIVSRSSGPNKIRGATVAIN